MANRKEQSVVNTDTDIDIDIVFIIYNSLRSNQCWCQVSNKLCAIESIYMYLLITDI